MRTVTTATGSPTKPLTEAPPDTAPTGSPWQYPIPYLLGGLVTMTILVATALLILACSYWKRNSEGSCANRDLEAGGESVKVYKDKVLVIMAGNEIATYLATSIPVRPIRDTSFEEDSEKIGGEHNTEKNSEILKEAAPSIRDVPSTSAEN